MAKLEISLKARALRYLSMREHSRIELMRKLARYAKPDEDVNALLDFLESKGWLSQQRFSEAIVHSRLARFGNERILHELKNNNVASEIIQDVSTRLLDDEVSRACAVWARKFGTVAASALERAKQIRFLLQRGFSQKAIQAAVRGCGDIDIDEH